MRICIKRKFLEQKRTRICTKRKFLGKKRMRISTKRTFFAKKRTRIGFDVKNRSYLSFTLKTIAIYEMVPSRRYRNSSNIRGNASVSIPAETRSALSCLKSFSKEEKSSSLSSIFFI